MILCVSVQSIAEFKRTELLPYFCFGCRAFTKQARLIVTARDGKPFLSFFDIEPLVDCNPGCRKHAELKLVVYLSCCCCGFALPVQKEYRDALWGKYWCNKL